MISLKVQDSNYRIPRSSKTLKYTCFRKYSPRPSKLKHASQSACFLKLRHSHFILMEALTKLDSSETILKPSGLCSSCTKQPGMKNSQYILQPKFYTKSFKCVNFKCRVNSTFTNGALSACCSQKYT
jgi:hypothetical protein